MSSKWPVPGIGMVAEYQRSGTPYVTASNATEVTTSSPIQISFPRVTRWIEISTFASAGSPTYLKVGFTENGIEGNGAVTGSIPTGEMNESTGKEVFVNVQPKPSAYEQSATARNWFAIPSTVTGTSHRLEVACTDLFIMLGDGTSAGVSVMAGLTGINESQLSLTGSNGFYGVG